MSIGKIEIIDGRAMLLPRTLNATAFCEGVDARAEDEEFGTLTDCPYTTGTQAASDWYRGYNDED